MRFIKRLAGILGFGNPEVNKDSQDDDDDGETDVNNNPNSAEHIHNYINTNTSNLPRKGFSVSVQVPVDRAHQIGPILVPCPAGDGGVQGLKWYTQRLKIDEDGDVADEFLEEVFSETVSDTDTQELHQSTSSKLQVKLSAKPAKARNPCLSKEGTVQHYVKYQGRMQLTG
uniref:uncharacterized protein LOC122600279 n=1 Tax=Erigeron canadensis TaxID=72917 RepID=UPI001CB9758E|nr:uncharacterized protein LOC122600279 [Erigeron canadensis]